jgi:hypothetical protein
VKHWQYLYDSVTQAWHERLPTNSAILCHYFGQTRGADIQRISVGFSRARMAHKARMLSNPLAARYSFNDDTDSLRQTIYLFELAMADLLRSGDILEEDPQSSSCASVFPRGPLLDSAQTPRDTTQLPHRPKVP